MIKLMEEKENMLIRFPKRSPENIIIKRKLSEMTTSPMDGNSSSSFFLSIFDRCIYAIKSVGFSVKAMETSL